MTATKETVAPQPVAAAPADDDEAAELLDDLIASIQKDGNYSVEATLTFLGQIRQCIAPAAPVAQADDASPAARDVLAERRRQVEAEGWTPEHDDKYSNCELARAAATYALCSHVEQLKLCGAQVWPWHPDWWKRGSYRRDLVKAGALILAEIDRVDRDRTAAKGADGQGGAA